MAVKDVIIDDSDGGLLDPVDAIIEIPDEFKDGYGYHYGALGYGYHL